MRHLFWPAIWLLKPGKRLWYFIYRQLDGAFRLFDDRRLLIVDHLHLIPPAGYRTGGQSAISEYGYSVGAMAAYIGEHLVIDNPQILDIGCGTGKMVSAVWPFLGKRGHYTGIDISKWAIDFANSWYPTERCTFAHAPVYNARYSHKTEADILIPFEEYSLPLQADSIDLALAFSLFTHLNQPDATHYFRELARVLKPGGLALPTFFLMDKRYDREKHKGTYWEFDRTIEGQPEWHWSSWFDVPERLIAVTPKGIDILMDKDFELIDIHKGWWTGRPGAFLQDSLVFRRTG